MQCHTTVYKQVFGEGNNGLGVGSYKGRMGGRGEQLEVVRLGRMGRGKSSVTPLMPPDSCKLQGDSGTALRFGGNTIDI